MFCLKRFFIFLLIISGYSSGYSQRETSIWFFNHYQGLDFNYDPPVEVYTPLGENDATKAVMCDKQGKILFYTDGWSVYNSMDTLMENGTILTYPDHLGLNIEHYQDKLIIPYPTSEQKYLIFAIHRSQYFPEFNQNDLKHTLHYSIVDMGFNNGLGKVISKLNILCDSVMDFTIVGDRYNRFAWIVVLRKFTNRVGEYTLTSYKFNETGIEPKNVIAFNIDEWGYNYTGVLKCTPDGKKLLLALRDQGIWGIRLINFNNKTGEIDLYELITVDENTNDLIYPDFECSPNSKYLYAINNPETQVNRYNITIDRGSGIEASRKTIFSYPENIKGYNLQLNWKGEIVVSQSDGNFSLILDPDNEENPFFRFNAIQRSDDFNRLNHYPAYFFSECWRYDYGKFAGPDQNICAGDDTKLGFPPEDGNEYLWDPVFRLNNPAISQPGLLTDKNLLTYSDTTEYIVTLTDINECIYYDTTHVIVRPSDTRKIIGAGSVCPGSDSISYWLHVHDSEDSVLWEIDGGELEEITKADSILINWGEPNPMASVNATITNKYGCLNPADPFNVKIFKVIDTEIPNGADTLDCFSESLEYNILPKYGSFFDWQTVNGLITEGYGTHNVSINWDREEKYGKVWINESIDTDLEVCFGQSDTLHIVNPTAFGSENIHLYRISGTLKDSLILLSDYEIVYEELYRKESFALIRESESGWEQVGPVEVYDSYLELNDPEKNINISNYTIEGLNLCDIPVTSVEHRNILLKTRPVPDSSMILLKWNNNPVWQSKKVRYDIYRKLDDEFLFKKLTSTQNTQVEFFNLGEGFTHLFYVDAVNETDDLVSMSNISGFDYRHPVNIPNVFTPNGDEHNDFFEIINSELYSENELRIFNRYGKEILNLRNYQNNWNGGDLPAGTYYYLFETQRYGQVFKGWFDILR